MSKDKDVCFSVAKESESDFNFEQIIHFIDYFCRDISSEGNIPGRKKRILQSKKKAKNP